MWVCRLVATLTPRCFWTSYFSSIPLSVSVPPISDFWFPDFLIYDFWPYAVSVHPTFPPHLALHQLLQFLIVFYPNFICSLYKSAVHVGKSYVISFNEGGLAILPCDPFSLLLLDYHHLCSHRPHRPHHPCNLHPSHPHLFQFVVYHPHHHPHPTYHHLQHSSQLKWSHHAKVEKSRLVHTQM